MRIIAGTLRGRVLRAPKGDDTRPTSNRVRESLFAVLGDVHGAVVLDLFAGTGALAIEAISRGASRAVCVESGRHALPIIRANVESLGLGAQVQTIARKVGEASKALIDRGPFDLVFADPPWALVSTGELARELKALVADERCVARDARWVVEHAARDVPPTIDGLVAEQTRTWGDTAVTFFARGE